jgi:hypothetical protein
MNRRDLLKKLSVMTPAIATIPFLPDLKPRLNMIETPDDFMYRGWRMHWRDWVSVPNMDARVGIWAAYSPKLGDWHLCSCWPGMCGSFLSGQVLDISTREHQTLPTFQSTPEDLAYYRNESLECLKRLIHRVGSPPLEGPVWL